MKLKRSTVGVKPQRETSSRVKPSQQEEKTLATVLVAPIISEKATHIAEKQNQVFFKVLRNATKPEIKAAVEVLFKVEVESAQTASRGAKAQRFGRRRVLKPALAPRRLASDDLDAAIQSVAG